MTVAIALAFNGIIPPKEWYHDPTFRDVDGFTVALHLAHKKGIIPPKEWHHDPELYENKYGMTVAMHLARYDITPPE